MFDSYKQVIVEFFRDSGVVLHHKGLYTGALLTLIVLNLMLILMAT